MVEVAQDAYLSQNFELASEIYESVIKEKGPAAHLLLKLGNCLALCGRLSESFTAFLKAYRLNKSIDSAELIHLVQALVALVRERMQASSPKLLLDTKDILDNEPFLCGICLMTVLEPVTIYCGHTFCRKCLEKCDANICMCCGKNPEVTSRFQPNILLTDIMLKLFPKLVESISLKKEANEEFTAHNYERATRLYTKILQSSKYTR